jgi:tRNA (cytidine/uridine-2'-O-)-methyltransferase
MTDDVTFHVALFQPQIPPNTGNISRQCVGMNAHLHLIGPCGFEITDTRVKRAGLDYWDQLKLTLHETPEAFLQWLGDRKPWLVTRFGDLRYDKPAYRQGDVLLLGSETKGLPDDWLACWPDRKVVIPMTGPIRNFNLSNACAIVLAQACLNAGVYEKWQE